MLYSYRETIVYRFLIKSLQLKMKVHFEADNLEFVIFVIVVHCNYKGGLSLKITKDYI